MGARRFTEVVTDHGEGPAWLDRWGLCVLDMLVGDLVLIDASGTVSRRANVGPVVAAVRERRGGGLVVGVERGFAMLDEDLSVTESIECWTDPSVRMNDGGCDPQGRFWCGSMAYDLTPGAGALWRLDPDRATGLLVPDVGCSNGLAWTRDGSRAYHVDSLTNRVDVLEFAADGTIASRSPFLDVTGEGFPDGIAVDRENGVWLALFGSGRLIHADRYGRRDAEITVPAAQVTACTFGGPDFDELYITTSRYRLTDPEPAAGAVFVAEPSVGGFAPFGFFG
ncbi:SMP-30/gluconolactonase/LRE family protein [Streptomyces sp. SID5474]|nr:SMP-30/gluconolactonase/LRE family protein [Streptomyces sp. SID5474]